VQRVARTYLKPTNRTIAQFIPTTSPDRAEIPLVTSEEFAKLVNEYKGGEAVAEGEAFDPTPTNIEARTTRTQIGGLHAALLPKKNRGETVFANMVFRFGDENNLKGLRDVGSFAARLLMRGTAKRSRQQIQDDFDRLKAQVSVFGSANSAIVNIETTRANLPEVIDLVAEILKEPSFPENEFDTMKAQTLTNLESNRSEPFQVAIQAMSKHFNRYPSDDIRYAASLDESIEATNQVTLDAVRAFHKDFYGASNGHVAIVGDFDPETITEKLDQHFGSWKSSKSYARILGDHFDIPAANETFETPDKANAVFLARLNIKMNSDNPDYPALQIASSIIGGGFLNSRLATRIRQQDGLSYGVGANLQAPPLSEGGFLIGQAIYAPENRDKLEAAFREEIEKVIKDGFTAEEVTSAKQGYLLAQQRQRATDSMLASTWTNFLDLDRTFKWTADLESRIGSLTVEQVNAAARKYIVPSKISVFKAGDFAKAKAAGQ
jgi:zinc protease